MTNAARTRSIQALAIAGFTLLAFSPALHGGFVWDDHSLVENNPLLRGPLWPIWFTSAAKDYWPLTWTTFWLEWRLWGPAPAGYHLTNVALHAVAALALWGVLRRLGLPGAWTAALLFAVHPVAVESVAWISERKNTLSGALFLVAVLVWLQSEEGRRGHGYLATLALFGLALLAKTSVVALPVALLGVALARRGRLSLEDARRTAPFFLLSLAAGLVTVWFQHQYAMGGVSSSRTLLERAGGAGWALASYLQKAFVPLDLGVVYPPWPVDASSSLFWVPGAGLCAGAAVLWSLRGFRWARAFGWAVAFHAVMVAPVLGFVDMAYLATGPVSNHLQYLALLAPAALWGAALQAGLRTVTAPGATRWALPVLAAAVLALTTRARAAAFESDLTLWRRAVAEQPRSAAAHFQLSQLLTRPDQQAEAIAELEQAAQWSRDEGERHRALALRSMTARDPENAAREADLVLASSQDPDARRDAALVLLGAGRPRDAVTELGRLVEQLPRSSDYAYWLAAAQARTGRTDLALETLRRFVEVRPGVPRTEEAYAFMLLRAGRVGEARARAAAVIGVPPEDPRADARLREWMRQPGWTAAAAAAGFSVE